MSVSGVDVDWAVPVPLGYRVGGWEVTEPIATGNFGSVYAARRSDSDPADESSRVSLKFMAAGPKGTRQFREIHELAQREVNFSRDAYHERLLTIRESHVVDDPTVEFDGAVVLVMDRAEQSLQDLLDRGVGREPVPEAARLIVEICDGLKYLHASGWVHGDLKPSNILLMADGSVRLADFGLVTRLDGTHGYGLPLGSTDYLPPERWNDRLGMRGVRVRPSADVWALGVTAYQIVTGGSLPIIGETPGARAAAAQEFAAGRAPLRLQSDLDQGWREFVTSCLTPDHESRPPVTSLLDRARLLADPVRPASTRRPPRIRPFVLALAVLGVSATIGGAWFALDYFGIVNGNRPVELRVYNVEAPCRNTTDRVYTCSLGLALDPRQPYDAANVSEHRVWHDDTLLATCVLYDGERVADEYGIGSTTWYRVQVKIEPSGYAWLPAVRTRDDATALPTCD